MKHTLQLFACLAILAGCGVSAPEIADLETEKADYIASNIDESQDLESQDIYDAMVARAQATCSMHNRDAVVLSGRTEEYEVHSPDSGGVADSTKLEHGLAFECVERQEDEQE